MVTELMQTAPDSVCSKTNVCDAMSSAGIPKGKWKKKKQVKYFLNILEWGDNEGENGKTNGKYPA